MKPYQRPIIVLSNAIIERAGPYELMAAFARAAPVLIGAANDPKGEWRK